LAAVTTIIPYFGGLLVNILAVIIAAVVSPRLLMLTILVCIICPNIDGYIISPRVYGKTNNIPTLLTIFAVFAGGVLYGVVGIIIALPLAIILLATYRFYEDDIVDKLDDIKIKK
jgi:predicted PurR-regulated permease PerM